MKNKFDWYTITNTDKGIVLSLRDEYDRFEEVNVSLTYKQVWILKKAFSNALTNRDIYENLVRYCDG